VYANPVAPQPGLGGNSYATASNADQRQSYSELISGIAAYVIAPFIGAIAAVVLGHLGLSEIKKSAGRLKGDRSRNRGLVLGYLQIAGLPSS